jgi:hypothetical protein
MKDMRGGDGLFRVTSEIFLMVPRRRDHRKQPENGRIKKCAKWNFAGSKGAFPNGVWERGEFSPNLVNLVNPVRFLLPYFPLSLGGRFPFTRAG